LSDYLRRGRLESVRKDVTFFTSSVKSDKKLLNQIFEINKAHIIMLIEKKIIKQTDGAIILQALLKLRKKIKLKKDLEDAHIILEEEIIKEVGMDIGGNINLAKSRNDQVVTAIRMNLRKELLGLIEHIIKMQEALIIVSRKNLKTIIPGYTHLQPAQPITFAHYLLANFDVLDRSLNRIRESYKRIDKSPMGAGALATTSFPISRDMTAELLGFKGVLENSVDAVSTRDFILEVLADLTVMAVDLSRFVEDLIIWNSTDFGIIELPDEFASTSSIMPQKKNPDILEVIRARIGLIIGNFISATTILKALPFAYNLDLQELTPLLWKSIDITKGFLKILAEIVPELKVKKNLKNSADTFLTVTELANLFVKDYKISFRIAHNIVETIVKKLIEEGKTMKDITPTLIMEISKKFVKAPLIVDRKEILQAIDPEFFVETHKVRGGPNPEEVKRMLEYRKSLVTCSKKKILKKKQFLAKVNKKLDLKVKSYIKNANVFLSNNNT
jgi:argininosuccinate lyase